MSETTHFGNGKHTTYLYNPIYGDVYGIVLPTYLILFNPIYGIGVKDKQRWGLFRTRNSHWSHGPWLDRVATGAFDPGYLYSYMLLGRLQDLGNMRFDGMAWMAPVTGTSE